MGPHCAGAVFCTKPKETSPSVSNQFDGDEKDGASVIGPGRFTPPPTPPEEINTEPRKKCELCGIMLIVRSRSNAYTNHLRAYHVDYIEKHWLACDFCNKFFQKKHLMRHKKTCLMNRNSESIEKMVGVQDGFSTAQQIINESSTSASREEDGSVADPEDFLHLSIKVEDDPLRISDEIAENKGEPSSSVSDPETDSAAALQNLQTEIDHTRQRKDQARTSSKPLEPTTSKIFHESVQCATTSSLSVETEGNIDLPKETNLPIEENVSESSELRNRDEQMESSNHERTERNNPVDVNELVQCNFASSVKKESVSGDSGETSKEVNSEAKSSDLSEQFDQSHGDQTNQEMNKTENSPLDAIQSGTPDDFSSEEDEKKSDEVQIQSVSSDKLDDQMKEENQFVKHCQFCYIFFKNSSVFYHHMKSKHPEYVKVSIKSTIYSF